VLAGVVCMGEQACTLGWRLSLTGSCKGRQQRVTTRRGSRIDCWSGSCPDGSSSMGEQQHGGHPAWGWLVGHLGACIS
jgi:hypothetical protein